MCPNVFISRFGSDLNPIRYVKHCWYQMVVCLLRRTRQLRLKSTKGSLSNDDGDVNENSKKSNRFRLAKQQLCTCITLFVLFFAVVALLRNLPLRLEYLHVRWFNEQSGLYLSLYFVRSFVHHNRSKRSTQNYNAH